MKYHINPATGQPGKCTASTKPCRFGGENNHFGTKEEARKAIEQTLSKFTVPDSVTRNKKPSKEATSKARKLVSDGTRDYRSTSSSCSSTSC
jgi:hypothetical protein